MPVKTGTLVLCAMTVNWFAPPVARSALTRVGTVMGTLGTLNLALVMTPVIGAVAGCGFVGAPAIMTSVNPLGARLATQPLPNSPVAALAGPGTASAIV